MRNLIRSLIFYKAGNAELIHNWFDNWHPNSPLLDSYGYHILYSFGLPLYAKLSLQLSLDLNGASQPLDLLLWLRSSTWLPLFLVLLEMMYNGFPPHLSPSLFILYGMELDPTLQKCAGLLGSGLWELYLNAVLSLGLLILIDSQQKRGWQNILAFLTLLVNSVAL